MAELLYSTEEAKALDRLSAGLRDYQRASGKTSSAILVQKGAQLIYGNQNAKFGAVFPGLSQLFFQQAPDDGAIWAAARARGFRVGRKQYGGDLSPRAYDRAREMMGGFKTILLSSTPDGSGVSFVRAGVRKARVHYRYGRKSFAVSGEFEGPLREGIKRVNLRAVATFFELNKRTQGRRFLAASWLHRRWRKLAQSDPRRQPGTFRVLRNVNPRSVVQPLGTATLRGSDATGNLELTISSYVPGVKAIGTQRGLFVKAIEGVRQDLDAYIARKHAETLAAALKAGVVDQREADYIS